MANLTKTISNTLLFYGIEPVTRWDSLIWDVDPWNWRDVQWTFRKGIADSLSTDSAITGKNVRHLIGNDLDLSVILSRSYNYFVSDSFTISSAIAIINIINNNWILSKGGEPNALNWPVDNFTIVSDPTTSWTEITSSSTTWVQT